MTKEIETVAIIGAGTMGKEIGKQVALSDYALRIFDIDSEALDKAKDNITNAIKEKEREEVLGRISFHDNLSDAVPNADLIVESVPESLELKKKVFSQIDEVAPSHSIIATNSSSIPVSKIEDAVKRKDKVLNIHFYQPIPVRPMADIMRGTKTSDETFEKGKEWIESLKCTPLVVKKECMGFVFNRVWHAIKKECLKIWAGGHASVEDVDKAWKIFSGMDIGPFAAMDMVGLDVVYDIEMSYYKESGDPNDKPPKELKDKVDKGELGMKSGKGFYDWENM